MIIFVVFLMVTTSARLLSLLMAPNDRDSDPLTPLHHLLPVCMLAISQEEDDKCDQEGAACPGSSGPPQEGDVRLSVPVSEACLQCRSPGCEGAHPGPVLQGADHTLTWQEFV